ncbi:dihydroorotase [Fibrella forsythiae]|uniref:Dihydroorotase n=1 Tax=Fibrella forsythiae TaxID=2817061 RepID=A0ABS3JNS4_9BACT|nr:dihydroorotase [Fibrella forsythiae]MBO0951651.1 dihydroorotase [Fibrella forsythiae]
MHLLIRSARVVDTTSAHHDQVVDLLIENGLIRQIGTNLDAPAGAQQIIDVPNLHVSAGWVDGRASANDPGHEHRETLTDLARAAAAGGFTDVALLPNTSPVVDAKDTLGYVRRMAEGQPTRLHPMAAITKGAKGDDFTDMIDLHRAGAVAFTDGDHPLQNPDLLLKTLQYLRPMNGLLVNRAEDQLLTQFGQMHEGIQSTMLGLKGMPTMAEVMMIERDLRLLAYVLEQDEATASNVPVTPVLHFSCVSATESVELIRKAKARGLPVSCDVAAHQLVFTDIALAGFDTYLKVNPPFRSQADQDALWAGLADGTIDMIVSDHHPHDEESKNVEFDVAEFGISTIETVLASILTHSDRLPLATLVDRLTTGPRRVLRLPTVTIAEEQPAILTLFDPTAQWTYNRSVSPAKNSPFLGKTLTGNVLGTVLLTRASLSLPS